MPVITALKTILCRIAARAVGNRSTGAPLLCDQQPKKKWLTCSASGQKITNRGSLILRLPSLPHCVYGEVFYRYKLYIRVHTPPSLAEFQPSILPQRQSVPMHSSRCQHGS